MGSLQCLQLLFDVLPAFLAVGRFFACSEDEAATELRHVLSDQLPKNFCEYFYSEIQTLYFIRSSWDWVQEPDERKLRKILDVLESRFLSQRCLIVLGWTGLDRTEPFPKLQALQRKLEQTQAHSFEDLEIEEDKLEDEKLEEDQEETYRKILLKAVRISQTELDRKHCLKRLREGYLYLLDLLDLSNNSADRPTSQVSISHYPSKHVRNAATSVYKILQKHWSCKCPDINPHGSRKTHFSLTAHRRFETNPNPISSQKERFYTKIKFDILFPTNSDFIEWQESEIHVNFSDQVLYSRQPTSCPRLEFHAWRKPVKDNICDLIRCAQNSRLKMQVDGNRLWHLKSDTKSIKDIRESKFLSLRDLIKRNKGDTGATFSTIEGKDRLILSYILAISLLHFYEGPWLQGNWSDETICFLINEQSRGPPNLTKPLLNASCTKFASTSATLDQVHGYPSVLALGIILLEISLGTTMDLERGENEMQDGRHVTSKTDFLVALRLFDDWIEQSKRSISAAIPWGLKTAIEACLESSKIPYTISPPSSNQDHVLQYILRDIVIPLGTALSEAYEIPLEKLHEEISKEKQSDNSNLFDSYDDKHKVDQKISATKWFDQRLRGVHCLFDDFDRLPNENWDVGRVTVAVLDTGFEPPEGLMASYEQSNRIKESRSWVASEGSQEVNSENWRKDLDGHGTHVAYLLLRVAPVADVHIAQVFKTRKDLEDPGMAAAVHERIASALNYATNIWNVDIILISFGFDEPVNIIHEAIKNASKAVDKSRSSTLIFAATRNDGANKRVAWPARVNEVIGISSTDGDGQHSSFNPHDDGSNTIFYALGQAVEVACPSHFGRHQNKTCVSGTSFANPVAAGLAANVLGFTRLAVDNMDTVKEREGWVDMLDKLKSKDGMKAVFRHRMTMKNNSNKPCLLPWEFLKRGRPGKNTILNEIQETLRTR